MKDRDKLDDFTRAYMECALWSSTDDNGQNFDEYPVEDLHQKTWNEMVADCRDFQELHAELLENIEPSQAGHDFWLTRNHHGAGFWDRGLGDVGAKLTAIARAYGDIDLYRHRGLIRGN